MPVVGQPLDVAAEKCNSKLLVDPRIKAKDLYDSMNRFLINRGTNDLVALLKCMEGLKETDSPTKFGTVFLELKDLLVELILLAPNCVLPRLAFNHALEKLNGDRRWHFENRSLDAAAIEVSKIIRCVFKKLREIAKTSSVFHRFVAKVSVPNEFVAQSHRTRINSDQW